MKIKKILLIGLPNAGKSTIFNALCGQKISLTHEDPNTTLDYIRYYFEDSFLMDTAGLNDQNISEVILEADLFLFVIDGSVPVNELNKLLLKKIINKPIWLIVNKVEKGQYIEKFNFVKYENIFCFTKVAKHMNLHSTEINQLKNALHLKDKEKKGPLIAILGRANSGKSTLMNAILNEKRMIVKDEIGTTVDNVIEEVGKWRFMDTPGFRSSEVEGLDHIVEKRREFALRQADGGILVLDGSLGLTKIDKELLSEELMKLKFGLICVNKADVMDKFTKENFLRLNIPQWIRIIFISAQTKKLNGLFRLLSEGFKNSEVFIKTNVLNNWLQEKHHMQQFKLIKYLVQESTSPIIFQIFCKKKLTNEQKKFFTRILAKDFNLFGVNIQIQMKIE